MLLAVLCCFLFAGPALAEEPAPKPNIVFVVADDMGWRDTGYSGNPVVKTPHLDDMASKGVRFDYFYPGGKMCSPGRFAILTGRSPARIGLEGIGPMRPEEITVAKALKSAGYRTAHFGKWHLGANQTSPVKMGFDQAIWGMNQFDKSGGLQLNDTNEKVSWGGGDSSVGLTKLALDYIRKQAQEKQPFFVQICFCSPHSPHKGAEEFRQLYKDLPGSQVAFLAEVSGVDAAVGNLRNELRKLGIADNTIVWFCSDNGGITPESMDPAGKGKMNVGVRTVAVAEWPARVTKPLRTSVPCAHMDMYPTALDIAGVKLPPQPVLDGISLVPLFDGKMTERSKGLGFTKGGTGVWIEGKYKLIGGSQLFDILADPAERDNLAEKHPEIVTRMRQSLDAWHASVKASVEGKDYSK